MNPNQKWNYDKFRCKFENHLICEKDYISNAAKCSCKNSKYLASITDDTVITCDEIIEETKTVPTSFNETKVPCKLMLETMGIVGTKIK